MNRTLVVRTLSFWLAPSTLVLGATGDAAPSLAEFRIMQEHLRALSDRVQRLEAANVELAAQLLERSSASVAASQTAPAASGEQAIPKWHERLSWNGDLRLRHEDSHQEGAEARSRERLQTHFGLKAAVTDDLEVGLQLATGGDDPRSANQTMTGESSRKSVGLDLAYLSWQILDEVNLTGGKMKYPFYRPALSKLYDGDINPEGLALSFDQSGFFGSTYAFWLEERSADAETTLVGAQTGFRHRLSGTSTFTASVSYSDLGAGQGRRPFHDGEPNGNTLTDSGTLAYDFRVLQGTLELDTALRRLPVRLYFDYARNEAAPAGLDSAYSTGFLLGTKSGPHGWEFGYLHQKIEKDAWFGQFSDSDFGAGLTDSEGDILRIAYSPVTSSLVSATYYMNDLFISVPKAVRPPDDNRILQLDFLFTF
ncbi:MAG: putative porin [Steroidobacteraceae bacterium]